MIFGGRNVLIFHDFKCCLNMYKSVAVEPAVVQWLYHCQTLLRLCIFRCSCWFQKGTTLHPSWAEFAFHQLLPHSVSAGIKYLQNWLSSCHSDHHFEWFSSLRRPGLNAAFLFLVGSFLFFLAWCYFWKLNISSSIMLLETYSHLVHSSGSEMAIKENGSFETLMLWNKWCARTEI